MPNSRFITSSRLVPLALLLICILLPSHVLAKNIYVSNTHPWADDANPGSQNQPLATISQALQQARAGDSILVGAGTYRESLEFPRGGEEGRPITIKAQSDHQVYIQGSDKVTLWSPVFDQIWVSKDWGTNSQQVFCNDEPLDQIGSANPFHEMHMNGQPVLPVTGAGLEDLYAGSFWYDQEMGDLYVWLPDGSSPQDQDMQASVRPHIIASQDVNHIQLQGLVFAHSNTSVSGRDEAMVAIQGQDWTVNNCQFVYADLGALSIQGQDHVVQDSSFILHGSYGIGLNNLDLGQDQDASQTETKGFALKNSETSYNNVRNFSFNWMSGGIRALDGCRDVSIEGLLAVDNNGAGIWAADLCRDMRISRSMFQENFAGTIAQTAQDLKMYNNIFARNEFGLGLLSTQGADVQFNTFERNQYAVLTMDLGLEDAPLAYNTMRSNLFHHSGAQDVGILVPGFAQQDNVSDYNAYARDGVDLRAEWMDEQGKHHSTTDLQEFQEQTGLERNSMQVAGMWPADAEEYIPPAGSKVINAAYVSSAANDLDFYGRVRDTQNPDIGAVENITAVAESGDVSGDKDAVQGQKSLQTAALDSGAQPIGNAKELASKSDPADAGVDDQDDQKKPVTSVIVTWDDFQEPKPAGYSVLVGTKSREYDRKINAGSAKKLQVSGLKKNKKYYITAQAYTENGTLSEYGEEVVFNPGQKE